MGGECTVVQLWWIQEKQLPAQGHMTCPQVPVMLEENIFYKFQCSQPVKFNLYSCPALTFFMTFLQVTRPDGKPETLGLVVLDEPMAKQSDPTGTLYSLPWTRIYTFKKIISYNII